MTTTLRSSERPVRWGIIGCGQIARTMAGAIRAASGAELVAVASRRGQKAQAFAAEAGAKHFFEGYAQLAASPDVDVVYVATPPAHHMDDCLLCLDAGKHVLCEKPFAIKAEQARRMIARAKGKNLFLMEAMWTRFLPAVRQFATLVRDGRIGTPQVLIAGGAFQPVVDPAYYLFDPALGGGVMRDAGVYLLHLAQMTFGTPVSISAQGSFGPTGVDEQDGVLLRYANDAIATLYVSMRASQAPYLDLLGDQGRLRLHPPVFNPSAVTLALKNGQTEDWAYSSNTGGYRHQVEEVVACLGDGKLESPRLPLSDTLAVVELLERIDTSIASTSAIR